MCVYILFISSAEQIQLDFVEMLRVRDEKRRMRHVETLRQQKEAGGDEAEADNEEGGGGGARVELLGDLDEGQSSPPPLVKPKPQPPLKTTSYSPSSSSSNTNTNITNRHVRIKTVPFTGVKEILHHKCCHFTFDNPLTA